MDEELRFTAIKLLPLVTSAVDDSAGTLVPGVRGVFLVRTETCFVDSYIPFTYSSAGHGTDTQYIFHKLSNQVAPQCLLSCLRRVLASSGGRLRNKEDQQQSFPERTQLPERPLPIPCL